MRIGILSDSHGRADTTRAAVSMLCDAGATMLLHLGDIGDPSVIDELVGRDAHVVFGNCDLDEAALRDYAASVDVAVDHPLGEVAVGGRRIAFTHGHLEGVYRSALASGPDYLLHGHTHLVRDERVDGTRVINPGALHRAPRYTAALLDPALDRLELIEIPRD